MFSLTRSTSKPFLTIGIPTYNRGVKLDRLLNIISEQIREGNLSEIVEIVVSDNCSQDETEEIVQRYFDIFEHFKYYRQHSNIGYDLNVLSVYNQGTGDYVWLFADDDIPSDGAISKIVKALKNTLPDVLLFSFGQPPEATVGAFQFNEPIYTTSNLSECLELILRWRKISIYVLKKRELSIEDEKVIKMFLGDGWYHVVLALTILDISLTPKVAVISQILARCDADFDMLSWTPGAIFRSYRLADHPLVTRISPLISKRLSREAYLDSIQFCYAAKVGTLRVLDIKGYDEFISNLPWKLNYLIKNPKSFAQFTLLKLRLAHLNSK
jgi:glycosyltransferase involved in cell wall biosynthesis